MSCWILCTPRTGSSYLCQLLNNLNKFEPFDPPNKPIKMGQLFSKPCAFNEWSRFYINEREFTENPPPYAKMIFHQYLEIFSIPKNLRYAPGFYDLQHSKKTIKNTIEKYNSLYVKSILPNIKYIKINRDVITHTSSLFFARNTKKYRIYNQEELNNYLKIKIEFDEEKLLKTYKDVLEFQTCWDNFFVTKEHILNINYEEINSNTHETIKKIMLFLEKNVDDNEIENSINKTSAELIKMTRSEKNECEAMLKNLIRTKTYKLN